jgi:hypothetical protein
MRIATLAGWATLVVPGGDDRGVDVAEGSGGEFERRSSWVQGIGTIRTRFSSPVGGHHAG